MRKNGGERKEGRREGEGRWGKAEGEREKWLRREEGKREDTGREGGTKKGPFPSRKPRSKACASNIVLTCVSQ